jgi:hypothetical protein
VNRPVLATELDDAQARKHLEEQQGEKNGAAQNHDAQGDFKAEDHSNAPFEKAYH